MSAPEACLGSALAGRLVHVVLVRPHPGLSAQDHADLLHRLADLGEACGGAAAGILHWQVGRNLDERKGWTLVEHAVFADGQALARFRVHPAHVALGAWLRERADWVVADLPLAAAAGAAGPG